MPHNSKNVVQAEGRGFAQRGAIKNIDSFNNQLKDVFAKMSVNTKYKIVGSSNVLENIFTTDYDLNNFYQKPKSDDVYDNLLHFFRHLFKISKKDKRAFIIDFKCGIKNNEPIRWEYKDLMKGEKDGVKFIDALQQRSRIKLDMVYNIHGEFVEVSMIYYIAVCPGISEGKGVIKNYNDEDFESKNIILELKKDIDMYRKEHNYAKVLKRKYSLFKQEKTKQTLQEKILQFFNSPVGLIYKSVGDLKTIISLKEQRFRRVLDQDLFEFQQIIKQQLSIIDVPSIFNALDRNKLSVRSIHGIIKKLSHIINTSCKNEFGYLL